MKILALIPARGGSKGIPRKNVKPLAGKPLIAWTIEAALQSRAIGSVMVSTENEEIAEVARRHGAQVPFLRPDELAQDDTPSIDPVLHAIDRLEPHDFLLLLQPTSPLRTVEDIDACIALATGSGAQSVVSVSEPGTHPYWMYRLGPDQRLAPLLDVAPATRRQDLPPVYAPNGAIYLVRIESLRQHRRFVTTESMAYIMPPERSVDLDNMLDWKLAELLFKERN